MAKPTNVVPDPTDLGTLRPDFEPIAERASEKGTVRESSPKWKPLTVEELLKYYWNTDLEKHCGLHHAITSHMSRERFEAIACWFRITPFTSTSIVFEKLEPLNAHLQSVSRQLWIPGRDLAVDECMERFQSRSHDTLKIPSKPILVGYKMWVIAEKGYFLSWLWHSKGAGKGPHFDHGYRPPKEMGLNPTAAVVPYLVQKMQRLLDPSFEYRHILWLDNLFMSVKLALYLERHKTGCTGTARTNSGIWSELVQKKKDNKRNDTIPWRTEFEAPTMDGKVNMMAWKDNALVFMMSTTHTLAGETIIRT
ncbi:hypothetical protein B7463_g12741, partial [Scytalidium lignicola]